MKIWHFIPSLGTGGAERLLVDVCNAMCRQHEISVFYLKPLHDLKEQFDPAVNVVFAPVSLNSFHRFIGAARFERPDIIHTHFGPSDFYGHLIANYASAGTFATIHSVVVKNDRRDRLIYLAYRLFYGIINRKTTFIAISDAVATMLKNKCGISAHRIHVLQNAVPDLPVQAEKTHSDSLRVIFVGRLIKLKNVHVLLNAFALFSKKYPAATLTIVGDGPERGALEAQSKSLGLTNVTFTGKITRPHALVSERDVLVCPSETEGFGMVAIEAFRAETAVIASAIEGLQEIVQDGETGLLFPAGNVEKLAEALEKLQRNPDLRSRLAKNGRAAFLKQYELSAYIDRTTALYETR